MTKEIEQDENRLIAQRREKLAELRGQGNAFPNDFRRNVMNAELTIEYAETDAESLKEDTRRVKIAGRLMTKRVMGKASFATIRDMSGDMQLYVKRDDLAEGVYPAFKKWDLGDIIAAEGTLFPYPKG